MQSTIVLWIMLQNLRYLKQYHGCWLWNYCRQKTLHYKTAVCLNFCINNNTNINLFYSLQDLSADMSLNDAIGKTMKAMGVFAAAIKHLKVRNQASQCEPATGTQVITKFKKLPTAKDDIQNAHV